MQREAIVTDLTRFSTKEKVCIAMIDTSTGECIRPMPYFSSDACEKYNIQPGAIFTGNFTSKVGAHPPHMEDANYQNLLYHGSTTSKNFKTLLDSSCSLSISDGFNYNFSDRQKHIPTTHSPNRSIITIKVNPSQIEIHEDRFTPGKIKLTFTDASGHSFNYLAITDRGFFDFAMKKQNSSQLQTVQDFIEKQDDIYLRIGLSRAYKTGDRNGYWLQVNGIYTFPNHPPGIRCY